MSLFRPSLSLLAVVSLAALAGCGLSLIHI